MLRTLDKDLPLSIEWEQVTELSSEETEGFHKSLSQNFLHPDEVAQDLFGITNGMSPFNQNINEIDKNAMTGFRPRTSFNESDEN